MKLKNRVIHILHEEDAVVGQKALAVCGVVWKVKYLWADVPEEVPVCKDCAERAAVVMQEASTLLNGGAMLGMRLVRLAEQINMSLDAVEDVMRDGAPMLRSIEADHENWHLDRESKAEYKAQKARRKSTCICIWADAETRVPDLNCPVHAEEDQAAHEQHEDAEHAFEVTGQG